MYSITTTSLSVIFVIYGTVNHFETVVFLSFLMIFSYVQLINLLSKSVCLKSSFLSSLRVNCRTIHICLNLILHISILVLSVNHFWLDKIVLKLSGDIEEIPGPKHSSNQSFSICHWNLNVSLPIII